jgi:hypothetical protein
VVPPSGSRPGMTKGRSTTLPGVLLYERFGFLVLSRGPITLPDGVMLECAAMEKAIE